MHRQPLTPKQFVAKWASIAPKRTLTNLYNARPDDLVALHAALDTAVAAAYGWEWPLSDEEILTRLLALNAARAARGGGAPADGLVAEVEE